MKARIIAVLILISLIGIPVFWYWYFFVKNISNLTISVGKDMTAKVDLKGTFSYEWLPLADKALHFEKECHEKCTFGPIPPATYTVRIFAEGYSDEIDEVKIKNGDNIEKNYTLTRMTDFDAIELPKPMTKDEIILLQDDIQKILGDNFHIIGNDISGKIWIYKTNNTSISLGVFSNNRFISIKNFAFVPKKVSIDFLGNTLLLQQNDTITVAMSLQDFYSEEIPLPQSTLGVSFDENKNWNALTQTGMLTFADKKWKRNVRFTQWADIGEKWRAGYISRDDSRALSLGNYSEKDAGILVLINRKTGEVYDIAKEIEIERLFSHRGIIVFKQGPYFYSLKIPE